MLTNKSIKLFGARMSPIPRHDSGHSINSGLNAFMANIYYLNSTVKNNVQKHGVQKLSEPINQYLNVHHYLQEKSRKSGAKRKKLFKMNNSCFKSEAKGHYPTLA